MELIVPIQDGSVTRIMICEPQLTIDRLVWITEVVQGRYTHDNPCSGGSIINWSWGCHSHWLSRTILADAEIPCGLRIHCLQTIIRRWWSCIKLQYLKSCIIITDYFGRVEDRNFTLVAADEMVIMIKSDSGFEWCSDVEKKNVYYNTSDVNTLTRI